MTLYEHDLIQNYTQETNTGENTKKAAKPSLFERIRRAFTPKMAIWLITPVGRNDTIIYATHTKKAAFLAAQALVFRHFYPHYSTWLPFHGYGVPNKSDTSNYGLTSDAWQEYLSVNLDEAEEYLSTLEIRRALYDHRSFAAMVRVMCGVAPLGLDFETDEEIECWVSVAMGASSKQEKNNETREEEIQEKKTKKSATSKRDLTTEDDLMSPVIREQGKKSTHNLSNNEEKGKEEGKVKAKGKAKKKENPSTPLDKQEKKEHNVSGSENKTEVKRGPGRPRKKEGSPKKAPGTKKGGSNEN